MKSRKPTQAEMNALLNHERQQWLNLIANTEELAWAIPTRPIRPIDPHGDLTHDAIAQLPPELLKKTYMLDPTEEARP